MGREIRRVPLDWKHPQQDPCPHAPACRAGCYQPLRDQDYDTAARVWLQGLQDWEADKDGERSRERSRVMGVRYFWDWDGMPPDKTYYRPAWTPEQATAYQMYETESEGTPVTPVFATKAELVDYLVTHGDFWDQERGDGGWSRANAERFVERGHALSMTVEVTAAGSSTIRMSRDGA